jgi:hypothetical protein
MSELTHEELAIRALPPVLQRRMARLVLAGWHIRILPVVDAASGCPCCFDWIATSDRGAYRGPTLLTLLAKLVVSTERCPLE